MSLLRTCSQCNEEKPDDQFGKNTKGSLSFDCLACIKQSNRRPWRNKMATCKYLPVLIAMLDRGESPAQIAKYTKERSPNASLAKHHVVQWIESEGYQTPIEKYDSNPSASCYVQREKLQNEIRAEHLNITYQNQRRREEAPHTSSDELERLQAERIKVGVDWGQATRTGRIYVIEDLNLLHTILADAREDADQLIATNLRQYLNRRDRREGMIDRRFNPLHVDAVKLPARTELDKGEESDPTRDPLVVVEELAETTTLVAMALIDQLGLVGELYRRIAAKPIVERDIFFEWQQIDRDKQSQPVILRRIKADWERGKTRPRYIGPPEDRQYMEEAGRRGFVALSAAIVALEMATTTGALRHCQAHALAPQLDF